MAARMTPSERMIRRRFGSFKAAVDVALAVEACPALKCSRRISAPRSPAVDVQPRRALHRGGRGGPAGTPSYVPWRSLASLLMMPDGRNLPLGAQAEASPMRRLTSDPGCRRTVNQCLLAEPLSGLDEAS